jgi:hypothetical protein
MRALIVTTVLLTSFGPGPLLAQDPAKSPPNASQPQVNSNASTTQDRPANHERQKRHTLERMGPGIDWDHRKPGRDWKITPGHEGGNAKHE